MLSFARARPVAARHQCQRHPIDTAGLDREGGAQVADNLGDTNANRPGDADGEDGEDEDEDDEMSGEEKARRSRWLVSGGKDGRVVVWALMDFTSRGNNDGRRQH